MAATVALDAAGVRAIKLDAGRDHLYHNRRGTHSAPVGVAAGTLPPDIHPRICATATSRAILAGSHPVFPHRGVDHHHNRGSNRARLAHRHSAFADVLCRRDDLPQRTGQGSSTGSAPDGFLSLPVRGRRAGWDHERAACARDFSSGMGISLGNDIGLCRASRGYNSNCPHADSPGKNPCGRWALAY